MLIILFSLAGVPPLGGFAKFYVFVAVLEKEMYALAIIGLLTTVMSAFLIPKNNQNYLFFDDNLIVFESTKNRTAQISIFTSCAILISFFFISFSFK